MAALSDEFELGEILLILGAVIAIGYFVYKAVSEGVDSISRAAQAVTTTLQNIAAIPGKIADAVSTMASDFASGNPGSGGTGEGGVFGTTGSSDADWTAG